MAQALTVRPLRLEELDAYVAHLDRHVPESGQDGNLVFAPFTPGHPWRKDDLPERLAARWLRHLDEPDWERSWGLWADDQVIGHAYLRAGLTTTRLHRCNLGMGIERAYRGQGGGHRLLATVIEWARSRPGLAWIDLNVFGHNQPAIALYERHGFCETGRVVDAFRIAGQGVEDRLMTLRVEG